MEKRRVKPSLGGSSRVVFLRKERVYHVHASVMARIRLYLESEDEFIRCPTPITTFLARDSTLPRKQIWRNGGFIALHAAKEKRSTTYLQNRLEASSAPR